jgi:multiple sugar transport system ATP-binding protein
VTLGIRPKDLRLARLQPQAEYHAATVVLSEMMGAETLMQIRVGANELIMLVDDRDTAATGSTIEIAFTPEGLRLFDAASGKAIAPSIAAMLPADLSSS